MVTLVKMTREFHPNLGGTTDISVEQTSYENVDDAVQQITTAIDKYVADFEEETGEQIDDILQIGITRPGNTVSGTWGRIYNCNEGLDILWAVANN